MICSSVQLLFGFSGIIGSVRDDCTLRYPRPRSRMNSPNRFMYVNVNVRFVDNFSIAQLATPAVLLPRKSVLLSNQFLNDIL